ncbi:hypothetical protein DEI99_009670 [Curtobacterium sp. MCLR17_036]|uniref:hypothetical protein n=1 Tax=Curtobacterium sp. MCLR17_036 TaxID=2175620 RepID=UPI000DA74301|nr:hypothetical protein [Curtobacterium sp. MCLR17_036]WIE63534.1 hypothetical protein DEI99_009670 [Curtobacterium sp. MCLR17_036]
MSILRPLPDAPDLDDDDEVLFAWDNGATLDEWREAQRTGVVTLSMRVKWWWRRTRRVLR